jgi:ketosteroid isomerase-like protein
VDEYRELDDERVLVLQPFSGRGRASELELGEMRTKAATVYHVREGKVTRIVVYLDCEHALADLGLSSGAAASG